MIITERIPRHSDEILWRIENSKAVIFHDAKGEPYMLNETGTLIWSLCDGNRSVKDIASELLEIYEGKAKKIENEIISFIELLAEKDILILT